MTDFGQYFGTGGVVSTTVIIVEHFFTKVEYSRQMLSNFDVYLLQLLDSVQKCKFCLTPASAETQARQFLYV